MSITQQNLPEVKDTARLAEQKPWSHNIHIYWILGNMAGLNSGKVCFIAYEVKLSHFNA